jgi:hypothetical protein
VPKRIEPLLKWVFGLAGIAFLVIVFRDTWRRSQGLPIPKAWAFLAAAILIIVGLFCLARGWVMLLPEQASKRSIAAGFYASQLGRYIPGAVWQALAQVGLATRAGASLSHASTAFGIHALVQLAAGGAVGAALVLFGSGIPLAIRLSAPLALLPLFLLRRKWLVRALHIVERLTRRTFADDLVPSQGAILSSYGWTVCTLVANSLAFTLLLSSLPGGVSILASSAAFGLAWTIGFLAVPFPSGVGVREAVLLVTIGYTVSRSHVIAASISHRLVVMAAELLVVMSSRIRFGAVASRPSKTSPHSLGP